MSWEFVHGPELKGTNNHCHCEFALAGGFVSKWTPRQRTQHVTPRAFSQTVHWAPRSLLRFKAVSVGGCPACSLNPPPSFLSQQPGSSLLFQGSQFPEQEEKKKNSHLVSILNGDPGDEKEGEARHGKPPLFGMQNCT